MKKKTDYRIGDDGTVDFDPHPEPIDENGKPIPKSPCVQCTNLMHFYVGYNAYVCKNPICPNFGLYQTGVESL